jgi:AraC-like DNA-binding protein
LFVKLFHWLGVLYELQRKFGMPYERLTLASSACVTAERLVLLDLSNRWSPEYESNALKVVLPVSGYVCIRTRHGDDLVDSASAFCMSPHSPYQMRQAVPQTSIVLTASNDAFADELTNANTVRACQVVEPKVIAALHRFNESTKDALATEESLVNCMTEVLHPRESLSGNVHSVSLVAKRATLKAREYLAVNFAENFSLADIARASCASPFHLSRSFRLRYGVPLFAFRERLRLAMALRALKSRNRDLSTLALDLGYTSHSHFGAAFKRAFGMSPSKWVAR